MSRRCNVARGTLARSGRVTAVRWATRGRGAPFGVKAPRRAKPQVRALSLADVSELLENIGASERGNAVLFSLATGMRRGEIAGLRKQSIDMARGVVVVCESRYEVVNERGQKKTKSERVREVALSTLARETLDREVKRQGLWKEKAGDLWVAGGHVFTDERG